MIISKILCGHIRGKRCLALYVSFLTIDIRKVEQEQQRSLITSYNTVNFMVFDIILSAILLHRKCDIIVTTLVVCMSVQQTIRYPKYGYRYLLDVLGKHYDNPLVQLYKNRFPHNNLIKDDDTGMVLFKHDEYVLQIHSMALKLFYLVNCTVDSYLIK